jgi:hypothetical protein
MKPTSLLACLLAVVPSKAKSICMSRQRKLIRLTIVAMVIALGAWRAFGLGGDYPNNRPVGRGDKWPQGVVDLVNSTNRVAGFFWNAEDLFFFSGSALDLTAFLQQYSKIQGIESHRLLVHHGVGDAKAPWEKTSRPCDWKLFGCPKGWLNLSKMAQGTNSIEELRETARDTNYVLEVHFWTGGRIPLDKVTVPQGVEVIKDKWSAEPSGSPPTAERRTPKKLEE